MQHGLRALNLSGSHRSGAAHTRWRLALTCVALATLASGCGPSWVGDWDGTADLGPVNAYTIELRLAESPTASVAVVTAPNGAVQEHQVCTLQVKARRMTFEIDTGRADCSAGPGADRLRFEGELGARVIHGTIHRGEERVGFFRAFPKRPPEPEVQAG